MFALLGRMLRPRLPRPAQVPEDPWYGAGPYNRCFREDLEMLAEEISSPRNPVTTRGNPKGRLVEFVQDGKVIATTAVGGEFGDPYEAYVWTESDELFGRLSKRFKEAFERRQVVASHWREFPVYRRESP